MSAWYMTHSSCFEESARCDYDGVKVHRAAIYLDNEQQAGEGSSSRLHSPPRTACPLMARQMEAGEQHASEWQIPILIHCGG